MHRDSGYFVVERPIPYGLTPSGEGMALAIQARAEREQARASAPLGRSPAVLPSQKQAAASEPECAGLHNDWNAAGKCADCGAEQTDASRVAQLESARDSARPDPRPPAAKCKACRELLQELSKAVHAFSAENGPFVRAYAHLSVSQVAEGKKRLEALGKTVREAQQRFRAHTLDAH